MNSLPVRTMCPVAARASRLFVAIAAVNVRHAAISRRGHGTPAPRGQAGFGFWLDAPLHYRRQRTGADPSAPGLWGEQPMKVRQCVQRIPELGDQRRGDGSLRRARPSRRREPCRSWEQCYWDSKLTPVPLGVKEFWYRGRPGQGALLLSSQPPFRRPWSGSSWPASPCS